MIRDEKYMSLREEARPSIYVPVIYSGDAHFYVRTARPPAAVVPEIRRAAQSAAPGVPVYDLRTMDDQLEERLRPERMIATLAICFGALALDVVRKIALHEALLRPKFSFGAPTVAVERLRVDGTLELVHDHATDGRGLDHERSARVLDYLVKIWRRPIVLSSVDGEGRSLQLTANPA